MQLDGQVHLSYCTNIHAADGWTAVLANLRRYAPALKHALSPHAPFGLGLRLSAAEGGELLHGDNLRAFADFLLENGLYVALLNGFPYGQFHNCCVKQDVFGPDWRSHERVCYTLRLLDILGRLLPQGIEGGISTIPLSYSQWVQPGDREAWAPMAANMARVAAAMARVQQETGRHIHLDIEPEPWGLLQTSADVVAFFRDWLLPVGSPILHDELGVTASAAAELIREHVRVCFDSCHFAVQYENPEAVLESLTASGIKIGRVQVSSALRIVLPSDKEARHRLQRELACFAEPTYLHQVVERRKDGSLASYPDLPHALPCIFNPAAEVWRVHFHVPIFVKSYGALGSTHEYTGRVLDLVRRRRFTEHLEIETYTWDVLPKRDSDLAASIAREYRWVLEQFSAEALKVPA